MAASNAAYLLRAKVLAPTSTLQATSAAPAARTVAALQHGLVFHLLRGAEVHGQAESWLQLGHLFVPRPGHRHDHRDDDNDDRSDDDTDDEAADAADAKGLAPWLRPSYAHARYCYERAVAQSGHRLALVYLGVLHHFGLGDAAGPAPTRAARYYAWATAPPPAGAAPQPPLSAQMQWLVSSLQTALAWAERSSLVGHTLQGGLDYVASLLWQ